MALVLAMGGQVRQRAKFRSPRYTQAMIRKTFNFPLSISRKTRAWSAVDAGRDINIEEDDISTVNIATQVRGLVDTTEKLNERLEKAEKQLAEYQAIAGVDELRQKLQRLEELERIENKLAMEESAPWYKGNINLGEIGRLWLGQSEIPVAVYKPTDILELFGGALFLVLKRFQEYYGSAYLLPTGPTSSFLVLSDPQSAKHVLNSYGAYEKGLVREIAEFLFGDGFAVADGKKWKIRRRAVAPSLHKKYLNTMVNRVFADCSYRTADLMAKQPEGSTELNMEKVFSELTLDIIGKAVFNYDFNSISSLESNPVIEAVYDALKETERRSLDFLPLWKLPPQIAEGVSPRQKRATEAVKIIRDTTEQLIESCRLQLEKEEREGTAASFNEEDYVSDADPSVLRFLIASREEVTSSQLRDDLLSMLVAGHETTGSVLTWTLYLLTTHPDKMAKLQEEIDARLGKKIDNREELTIDDMLSLNYLRWAVAESMRLYPHPPVLIRRAMQDDVLPSGWKVPKGQDVMISIYNIHHSPSVWNDPEVFMPERWSSYSTPRDNPNERNTNYHYIPFSGGARKCIGDQFALLEAYTSLAILLRKFDFQLVPGQEIGMTTGATIHTTNGMRMTFASRMDQK
eukprot:CAMPEP_0167754528 /NCGR_PEP_ID=MMETSP0110_2-20121227/8314_1 /TAXON_ID=629695 /ORGANISM="Gymnochlora sp., Strain CCMP2014" /LENGTH=629 /DNA_ID=CAMNT_0007640405 /DNA_START=30 /DNA_END=1919 /DNA_ORIENTATION=+